MKIYLQLFWSFFKIGLFTFGGGYAMLPLLQKEVIKKGWASEDEIMDYYAIGQITPGIIAINVSTFVGFKIKGFLGACATMFGMILPSFLIITSLALGLSYIWENPIVRHAFNGIKIVIPALMAPVLYKMAQKGIHNLLTLSIFIVASICTFLALFSPLWIVLTAGCLGFLCERGQK